MPIQTPICDFGQAAKNFELKSKAMKQIAETNNGPKDQIPSMGCGIKWFNK